MVASTESSSYQEDVQNVLKDGLQDADLQDIKKIDTKIADLITKVNAQRYFEGPDLQNKITNIAQRLVDKAGVNKGEIGFLQLYMRSQDAMSWAPDGVANEGKGTMKFAKSFLGNVKYVASSPDEATPASVFTVDDYIRSGIETSPDVLASAATALEKYLNEFNFLTFESAPLTMDPNFQPALKLMAEKGVLDTDGTLKANMLVKKGNEVSLSFDRYSVKIDVSKYMKGPSFDEVEVIKDFAKGLVESEKSVKGAVDAWTKNLENAKKSLDDTFSGLKSAIDKTYNFNNLVTLKNANDSSSDFSGTIKSLVEGAGLKYGASLGFEKSINTHVSDNITKFVEAVKAKEISLEKNRTYIKEKAKLIGFPNDMAQVKLPSDDKLAAYQKTIADINSYILANKYDFKGNDVGYYNKIQQLNSLVTKRVGEKAQEDKNAKEAKDKWNKALASGEKGLKDSYDIAKNNFNSKGTPTSFDLMANTNFLRDVQAQMDAVIKKSLNDAGVNSDSGLSKKLQTKRDEYMNGLSTMIRLG